MIDTDRLHRSIHRIGGLLLLLAGLLLATNAHAQVPSKDAASKSEAKKPHPKSTVLDVNNSAAWVSSSGFFDWNLGYTAGVKNGAFPARTGTGTIFSQGMVWGGKVKDGTGEKTVRVGGSTYENGLNPGGLNPDGTPQNADATWPDGSRKFRVYRVHRNFATSNEVLRNSAGYENAVPAADVTQGQMNEMRKQYKKDWEQWPAQMGAPYEECNGQPGYQPAIPDSVGAGKPCRTSSGAPNLSGDIPGRPGADQTLWFIANDVGSRSSTDAAQTPYSSPAIGLEAQFTLWGYDRAADSPLGNINFIETKMIYQGTKAANQNATTPRVDSMFTSWWVDPDVGSNGDDFAGVDTSLSLGYAYNSSAVDGAFSSATGGRPPPAVGFDFLKGPKGMGLTSYVFFAAGSQFTDPTLDSYQGSLQWFNLMRGFQPRPAYPEGDPFINPITNQAQQYALTGNPITGTGWIDGATVPPGDRRIVNTSGPFSMAEGDTVSVVVASISAVGSSNITSISRLKFFDQAAQFAFDSNFDIPGPPASPSVQTASLDKNVVLNWGADNALQKQIENYTAPPGFQFEAYRVYQLPSATASLSQGKRIATYDVANNTRTLVDKVFEEESGFVVTKPVQSLTNEGIQRYHQVTKDVLRDRPLANGVDYHFAVTALGYLDNPDASVPSLILESSPTRVTVRPEPPQPGTVDSTVSSFKQSISVAKGNGVGNGNVKVQVIDPRKVRTSDYTITIAPNQTWTLRRGGSNGTAVLTNQGFGVQPDRDIADGLKVDVSDVTFSKPVSIFNRTAITDPNGSLDLWGSARLFGAPVGFYRAFNPNIPQVPVEDAKQDLIFRFTGNGGMESPTTSGGQLATYCERAAFGATNPLQNSNLNCNTIRAPFELYERERNRQIQFAIIGRNADGNSPWGDGAAPSNGGYYRMAARDYIVPVHKKYDQQEVQNNGTNPGEGSWLLFFEQGGISKWDTGDAYKVSFANPLQPGTDTWTFSTDSTKTGKKKVAKATVKNIGVFPNPYRGFNKLEKSRFDKFVRFTHLPDPEKFGPTTIRIFTLSGNPVRVLKHTQDSPNAQFRDWDLKNQSGVPVASGVYPVHISTPVGDKVLKVAIVQEEEILQRY